MVAFVASVVPRIVYVVWVASTVIAPPDGSFTFTVGGCEKRKSCTPR